MVSHYEENLSFDLGNLAAYDISTVEAQRIDETTRQNSLRLMQKLLALEKEENEEGEFLILPEAVLKTPRARPPPEDKPMTKWEKFRVSKGLGRRKKRSRLVYEPTVEGYVPRFGGYSIKKLKAKQNAIVEDKNGENPVEKAAMVKSLQRQEQKKREIQNKFVAEGKKDKKSVKRSLEIAKSSTAKLEHIPKKRVHKEHKGVKDEKSFNLEVLDMLSKRKKVSK